MSKGCVSYIRTYGIVLFLPLALGACRPKVATSSLGEVYLPDHLTSPRERLGYLIDHYWDKMEAQPDTSQALLHAKLKTSVASYTEHRSGLLAVVSPAL